MTTMDKLRIDDGYVLERTDAEAERLKAQAQLMVPSSERVLRSAGLVPGIRCLDAGCGPGEGMRILGRIVGPSGHVTGLDIDGATGERMLERLRAEKGTHFAFVAGDVTHGDLIPGAPFDLVFARLLLIHMTDPVAVVRHLGALVRPGGRLVLVDYDLSRMAVRPGHPGVERGFEIVTECFRRSGKAADTGLRLGEFLVAAGLPAPQGYDFEPCFGAFPDVGRRLESVLASLTPAAQALGIAAPGEVEALRAETRALIASGPHLDALGPSIIGVWTTLPS